MRDLADIYHVIAYAPSKNADIKRENANIDGESSMGAMLKYGSEGAKIFNLDEVIPEEFSSAHENGDIHIHDLDFYTLTETCCQIDVKRLLQKGFFTGHGYIRPPANIKTAANLACIVIQSNQNDQHGGQSIPMLDYALAPYVRKSYVKNWRHEVEELLVYRHGWDEKEAKHQAEQMSVKYEPRIGHPYWPFEESFCVTKQGIEQAANRAEARTRDDVYQAMEALVHNLNTMQSRAGSQVPFSSVNYGTDTSPEGRLVTEMLLKATDAGLGEGETPLFPVQIFKIKDGINYRPGDPNYDLFKLSIKVSAKRLYPNWESLDAPYNLQYYKAGDPDTEVATMGCVEGSAVVRVSLEGFVFDMTFEALWAYASARYGVPDTSGLSEWFDFSGEDVKVFDSCHTAYVPVLKLIRNPDFGDWRRVEFEDGMKISCTSDHPFPVLCKGRTVASDLAPGDRIAKSVMDQVAVVKSVTDCSVEMKGQFSYDFETVTDRFDVSGIRSHNCRTRVIGNVYDPTRETTSGRGNLSFTTINLPRLGIEARGDLDKFFANLDAMLELCHKQLLHRLSIQMARRVRNYPFLMGEGVWMDSEKLGWDDPVGDVLLHGTLSIGFIGLAECLTALIGRHHGEDAEARELGIRIVTHMRHWLDRRSREEKRNWTLLATPAEGLSGRFVRMDKERYGEITGVTDRDYYTNSFHIPVWFHITASKKVDIEAPYHALCNAGHITYIELDGDTARNLEAMESLVRYMHDKGCGYFAISHPVDRDPVCGYVGVINSVCPRCGRREGEAISDEKMEQIKRKYKGRRSGSFTSIS